MKRVHGAVLLFVNSAVALGLSFGLGGCAGRSDLDPAYDHASGSCGLKTTGDYLDLQKTCADMSSQTTADACKTASAGFLTRYPGISCNLVDPDSGERHVDEKSIRGMNTKASSFSAESDCSHPIARAFNKVLTSCISPNADVKVVVCAEACDRFKETAPTDVQCTINKTVLGRSAAVTQEVVRHLREQAGVDSDAGGACGAVIEAAFLKTQLACTELKTAADASICRTAADAFSASYPHVSCKYAKADQTSETVDAAQIAALRTKADAISGPSASPTPSPVL